MMYHLSELPDELTTDWILSKLRQEDIYAHYFGFYPDLAYKFTNPLRNDKEPGCSFFWYNNILFFRDFALGKTYTCFTIVRDKYEISFGRALRKICEDLLLGKPHALSVDLVQRVTEPNKKIAKTIKVTIQPWSKTDAAYWKSYYLTSDILRLYNAYSIKHAWLDDKLFYTSSANDPCTGYYFGNNIWKLYFYKRKTYRFVSNTNAGILQGSSQLKDSSKLVITKSMKDVMCYRKFNIEAVAPQSECGMESDLMTLLLMRYSDIHINYDNDAHGLREMNRILQLYPQLKLFTIPEESGYKDLSDYLQGNGVAQTLKLLQQHEICS